MEECSICYHLIENSQYTKINNEHEKSKYHVECLKKWLETSKHGINTHDNITSYIIYQDDNPITIVPVRSDVNIGVNNDNNEQTHVINHNDDNYGWCRIDNDNRCFCNGERFCTIFCVVFIIGMCVWGIYSIVTNIINATK